MIDLSTRIPTERTQSQPHRSIRERFKGNPKKLGISNLGGTTKYLGREHDGAKLVHYRGWREDLRPHVDRVKAIAEGSTYSKHGYGYMGSIPTVVILHWLNQNGKTFEDWGQDPELKARFKKWYQTRFKKLLADAHRERPLAINRSLSGRTAPRLGSTILNDYRKEVA